MENNFPEIITKRLRLREIISQDTPEIFFLRTDEKVTKYIERPEENKTKTIQDAKEFIAKLNMFYANDQSISWGICLDSDPKLIGSICLWNFSEDRKTAEVGYDLNPDFQGKGFMSEALQNVIKFGFEKLKLNSIEAFTHKDNRASKQLLERHRFILHLNRRDEDNLSNLIYCLKLK